MDDVHRAAFGGAGEGGAVELEAFAVVEDTQLDGVEQQGHAFPVHGEILGGFLFAEGTADTFVLFVPDLHWNQASTASNL